MSSQRFPRRGATPRSSPSTSTSTTSTSPSVTTTETFPSYPVTTEPTLPRQKMIGKLNFVIYLIIVFWFQDKRRGGSKEDDTQTQPRQRATAVLLVWVYDLLYTSEIYQIRLTRTPSVLFLSYCNNLYNNNYFNIFTIQFLWVKLSLSQLSQVDVGWWM